MCDYAFLCKYELFKLNKPFCSSLILCTFMMLKGMQRILVFLPHSLQATTRPHIGIRSNKYYASEVLCKITPLLPFCQCRNGIILNVSSPALVWAQPFELNCIPWKFEGCPLIIFPGPRTIPCIWCFLTRDR